MSGTAVRLYRLSGGGNDFLALAEPEETPAAEVLRAWCTRGSSLGADGLFVLERVGDEVRMTHYNADGGVADLCLNGTRCAARLATHLGWATGAVTVLTGAGAVQATPGEGESVSLRLEPPSRPPEIRELELDGETVTGRLVTVGVPHFVLEWPRGLADAPVEAWGPRLRSHPLLGEAGANVDFVRYLPPHDLEIRSFERGVEGETLACGTGVLASVAAALEERRLEPPVRALTLGGFRLEVSAELDAEGGLIGWGLAGDARLVAEIEVFDGASRLPPPPLWTPA